MRRFVFGILALAAAFFAAPQAMAQTVGGPIQVRTGDAFTVAVEFTQSAEISGQDYNARITQVYAVHVLNAEQRLWRFDPVSLHYDLPPELPGGEAMTSMNWSAISDAISAMMRIATDVGFECHVDEYGRCVEMTNWPFWSARVENFVLMVDGIARAYAQTQAPQAENPQNERPSKWGGHGEGGAPAAAPTWERMRGPVLQGVARLIDNFDSRDAAGGLAWVYPPAYVQGRTLTRRQPVSFVDQYDMPFGAPSLRYTGTLTLDRVNARENTAIVLRTATLDQESARAALRAMTQFITDTMVTPLQQYYPEGETPRGEDVAQMLDAMLSDMSYTENTRAVIDLSTGLAREITTDFTFSSRIAGAETPMVTHGRMVTRVTQGAPANPRLPRG